MSYLRREIFILQRPKWRQLVGEYRDFGSIENGRSKQVRVS